MKMPFANIRNRFSYSGLHIGFFSPIPASYIKAVNQKKKAQHKLPMHK